MSSRAADYFLFLSLYIYGTGRSRSTDTKLGRNHPPPYELGQSITTSPTMHAFIPTDAQFEALTANKNKTGNKHPKGAHNDKTNLRKVTGFNLCTQEYDAYIGGTGVAGTGAFSYPVYPGDCAEVGKGNRSIFSCELLLFGRIERCLALNAHLSTYRTTNTHNSQSSLDNTQLSGRRHDRGNRLLERHMLKQPVRGRDLHPHSPSSGTCCTSG